MSLNGRYWTGDPKEWAALAAWAIYVVLIAARFHAGWGGRRAAWLGIAGFAGRRLHLRLGDAGARGRGRRVVIVVVGLSHQTAPLEVREALAFPKERLAEALAAGAGGVGPGRGHDPLHLQPGGDLRPGPGVGRGAGGGVPGAVPRAAARRAGGPPLPARGRGRGAPRLPGRGQPRLDGAGRAADPRAGEAGLRGGGEGGRPRLGPERAAQPLVRRGQARPHRDRHRPQRRVGVPRRGGAGPEDLRRPARPVRAPGRGGEDERGGGAADGPRRRPRRGPGRPDPREGRAARGRPRRAGRAPRGAAGRDGAGRRGDQRHRGPGPRDPARGRRGGAGRAPATAPSSSSTSPCPATSSRAAGKV